MVFSLLIVVCVGDLRSWSDMECGTFPSSITDAGGTTPHFSQQAIGSSIQASSNISLDHSGRKLSSFIWNHMYKSMDSYSKNLSSIFLYQLVTEIICHFYVQIEQVPWFLRRASAVKRGTRNMSDVSTNNWSFASCRSCALNPL